MAIGQRSYYGRYTFVEAPRGQRKTPQERLGATLWLCPDCRTYEDKDTPDEACWAAHLHEIAVHGQRLYPVDWRTTEAKP